MKKIFAYILLLVGILVLAYPIIARAFSVYNQTTVIMKYEEQMNNISEKEEQKIKRGEYKYNNSVYKQNKVNKSEINFLQMGDVLGNIYIPKIKIYLPIYEGTSNKVLENGIGHMENTSLPCGGENTHSILVGHSGFSKSILFDNLGKLEKGDKFYINHLGKLLEYKVSQKNIVLPEETDNLKINKSEDLITLVTCIPKYVNSHRLLITGNRIPLESKEKIEECIKKQEQEVINIFKLIKIIIILLFFVILGVVVRKILRK